MIYQDKNGIKVSRNDGAVNKKPNINSNTACNLWNFDKIGFSGDQGKQYIICRLGAKRPLKLVGNNEKINYTVGNCVNATGTILPPFVVYKSILRLHKDWCVGGPPNTVFTTSKSDWMEKKKFIQLLIEVFIPTFKLIPVLDGHVTHVANDIARICIDNNIRLIYLPAHSYHILQPLDVGVHCHVKRVWRKLLTEFYAAKNFHNLTKENFIQLQAKLFSSGDGFTRTQIIAGFQNIGLFPLDISKIDQSKLQIAQTFQVTSQPATSSSSEPASSSSTEPVHHLHASLLHHPHPRIIKR
ncbi:uncharacterized protein LOC136078708 [Hydra vulgaris]|uniref:Uncharacterized protein LOC136078708 n=1 Tax=Hydra vulgaris TaxID=6087 RepID=A0ABM4BNB3_HYDVU